MNLWDLGGKLGAVRPGWRASHLTHVGQEWPRSTEVQGRDLKLSANRKTLAL